LTIKSYSNTCTNDRLIKLNKFVSRFTDRFNLFFISIQREKKTLRLGLNKTWRACRRACLSCVIMAFNFGKTQVHASVKATRLLLIKTPPARRTRIQYERATDSIPQHRTRRQAICHHQVPPFRRAVRLNGAINPRDRAADDLRLLPFHCPFADGQTASVHHTRT
jgi:hypothetical protein